MPVVKGFGVRTTALPAASCYVVAGPDTFFRRRAVDTVIKKSLRNVEATMALARYDSRDVPATDILNELNAPTLFASDRVIVVTNAADIIAGHKDALCRHAAQSDHPVRLVLESDQSPSRLRLGKKLETSAVVVACYGLRGSDLPQFLQAEARRHDKKIETDAVRLLADRIGPDAAALAVEMEKLSIFVGERDVMSAEDVDALVGGYRNYNVFELARCVVRGDARGAFAAAAKLREEGAAFVMIVGALAREMQRVMTTQRCLGAGQSAREAAATVGVPWWEADTAARTARRVDPERLEDAFCALAEADVAVKKGLAVEDTVLEELIARTASRLAPDARH